MSLPRCTLAILMSALTLMGCASNFSVPPTARSLTIAHVNDVHSHLATVSETFEILVNGIPTVTSIGGFPRLTEAFEGYAEQPNVLKLHAGDALQGSLYYTLFKGDADAALMNTICFDAMVVGNHEFDNSDTGLRHFIDALHRDRCQTPVLGANVHPLLGSPLALHAANEAIQALVIKRVNGMNVGIIGVTNRIKARGSTRALPSTTFEDEVTALQREVDRLKAQGIAHIVVLSHMGFQRDLAVIPQVSDIDVVIGGDSHTLMGDFSTLGITQPHQPLPYPYLGRNKDGDRVCVAHAWEYGKALGELQVNFDAQGHVASCRGNTQLLLGTTFQRKNASGKWKPVDATAHTAILQALRLNPLVRLQEPNPRASAILTSFSDQVQRAKATQIAQLTEDLCFVRVPGESVNRNGGLSSCAKANELSRGSDVSQVVAEAFLDGSLAADMVIQNAGGVRSPIASGPITLDTAFTLLPFSNVLIELHMTGAQIVASLEDAVAHYMDEGASSGSHPYGAGVRWDLDLSQPRGQRFSALEVRDRHTQQWQPLELSKTYVVAANDYIASGKSGYKTFAQVMASGQYVNNYLLYAQTFIDYVKRLHTLRKPPRCAYSHKHVTMPDGRKLTDGNSPEKIDALHCS